MAVIIIIIIIGISIIIANTYSVILCYRDNVSH